tara:strand:- start:1 stop:330 length:330 start_codon:yes stop_codon:yes gene_type:complete
MKKVKEFIVKYKLYILSAFLLIFFFKSCSKSSEIRKLNKEISIKNNVTDSLENINKIQRRYIDSFPEKLRVEKLNIYLSIDDTISRVDRTPQLMGLHKMWKDSVKSFQK